MKRLRLFLQLIVLSLVLATATSNAEAQSERSATKRTSDSIVYHGKLVRPDGSPIEGSLSVTMKIYSPEPSLCLLWAETQIINAKNGGFSVELGYTENRLSSPAGGAANSFREVFLNNPGLIITGANCTSGNTYNPASNDDRLMSATFQDGGNTVSVERIAIKSVPFAKQAQEVAGYGIANLMKISGAGAPLVEYSPAEVQTLKDFSSTVPLAISGGGKFLGLNTAGTAYEYKSISAGANVTVTPVAGGIQISASGGGGGGGSGTVESVGVGGLPLSVVNSSSSPVISIAAAGAGQAGYLSAADWNSFNSKQPAGAYLTSVSSSDVTSALGFTPANSTNSVFANAILNGGNSGAVSVGSNDSQKLTLETAGLPRVTVDEAGNVGVGTVSPLNPLHIISSSDTPIRAERDGGKLRFEMSNFSDDSLTESQIIFFRSRGSAAVPQGLLLDDSLGNLQFAGRSSGSSSPQVGVLIEAFADEEFGTAGDGSDSPGRLIFSTTPNGSGTPLPRLAIKSDGRVGIGTISPLGTFQVVPPAQSSISNSVYATSIENYYFGAITTGAGKNYTSLHLQAPTSSLLNLWSLSGWGNAIKFNSAARSTTDENAALVASITGDSTTTDASAGGILRFTTRANSGSPFERMRIDSSGNVGIGTTTPGAKLDVAGAIRAQQICDQAGANCKTIASGWTSGSVTEVGVAGSPLSIINGSTTPQISIAQANGSQAGFLSSADWSSFNSRLSTASTFSGDVSGASTAISVDKIKGVTVSSTSPTTAGQVLRFDGASQYLPSFLSLADIRSSVVPGNTMFPASTCTSSQTLTWSSLTDTMTCSNIGSLNASVITAGTIDSARLPFGASLWQDGGSGKIHYSAGNVGIGTSSPIGLLNVEGAGGVILNAGDVIFGPASSNYRINVSGLSGTIQASNNGNQNSPLAIQTSGTGILRLGNATGGVYLGGAGTPASKVDVNGSLSVGASYAGVSAAPANGLIVQGNVGIGTASPQVALHVDGSLMSGGWFYGTSYPTGIRARMTSASEGLIMRNVMMLGWTSASLVGTGGAPDTALMRNSAGVVEVTNGTAGQLGDIQIRSINPASGSVGIGTSSPVAKLDVAGEVKFGNSSSTCNTINEGQQRYNSTSKVMEFCNGTLWTPMIPQGTICGRRSVWCSAGSANYDWNSPSVTCQGNTLTATCNGSSVVTAVSGCPAGYSNVWTYTGSSIYFIISCSKN